jgi:hypothetical protein
MQEAVVRAKKFVGRREHVSFPDLKLPAVEGKIDTGAYTSALHCHDITVENIEGKEFLSFIMLDKNHPAFTGEKILIEDFFKKEIKNSFGESELRYVIKTRVKIGNKIIKTPISLTDRGNMRYAFLVGRKILKNRFVVDVSGIFMCDRQPKKIKKKKTK